SVDFCPSLKCLLLRAFFLTLLRLPRPTLFPYTTLFRSRAGEHLRPPRLVRRADAHARRAGHLPGGRPAGLVLPRAPAGRHLERPDRKSTRLNSSHVAISYAVFRLKKKKI